MMMSPFCGKLEGRLAGWRRARFLGLCDLPQGRSIRPPSCGVYSPASCPSTGAFTVPFNSHSLPPAPIAAPPKSRACPAPFLIRQNPAAGPQKLGFLHNNPVTRVRVSSPGDWPWSSWRIYSQQDASILRKDRMR